MEIGHERCRGVPGKYSCASRFCTTRQFLVALSNGRKNSIKVGSHTNGGDELEILKRVVNTDVDRKASRSLFNTSITK